MKREIRVVQRDRKSRLRSIKNLAISTALFELRAMNSSKNEIKKSPAKRGNILLRLLGPGLVTGAADDDPSGIATYSQAGAQFGYGLLWTVFLTMPFMIAIQLVSAHTAA
jgi:Natural resistance-associated macrophage protein